MEDSLEAINFLPNVIKSMAKIQGERKSYESKGEPKIFRCLAIDEKDTKLGYLYYENNSKDTTLIEKVDFINLSGINIIGGDDNIVNVEVPPGEHKVFILDQISKAYTMKCGYFTSFHKSDKSLKQDIKTKGEKNQIKFGDDYHHIYYYVLSTSDGYLWMFENETDDIIFEGRFIFTLNNLFIVDNQGDLNEFKITLKPGEKRYMRMDTVDVAKSWGYKCKLVSHCDQDVSTEDKLIRKIIQKGERTQISYKKELIDVFYHILFVNDQYVWYFVNKSKRNFKANFKFVMENLCLDEDPDAKPRSQWDIFLEPGEACLKKMHQIDALESSKYECSYS